MINMKKKSSIAAVLLMSVLFLIFIAAMPKRVSAESPKGSIKISLKDLGTSRQNVALSLYKVGTWNGTGWELEACFNDTGISADTLQYASDWEAAAKTLSAHTALTSVERKAGQTDENGIWTMEELAWGMYLLVQEGESTYGTVSPALIAVPYVENGVQNSERIVYPKAVPPQEEDGGEENTPPNPDSGKEDTSTEPDNEDHNTSETIGGGWSFRRRKSFTDGSK